ncbi:MAG: alpha/beta hydrolase [Chloroflexota bacterium]
MTSATILFIHGGGKGAYSEDQILFDTLKSYFMERSRFIYPMMPNADSPDYDEWQETILSRMRQMTGKRILVGHSFGASILLKVLSEFKIDQAIAGVYLLATPYWGAPDWQADGYALRENFAEHLQTDVPIFLYHNADDDIVPIAHIDTYTKHLPKATIRKSETGGHQFWHNIDTLVTDIEQAIS